MKTRKPRPILLADDVSIEPGHVTRSNSVKRHAAFLANLLQTSIDLIHVEDVTLYPVNASYYRPFIERYLGDQKRKLTSLAESTQATIRPLFVSGLVVPRLLELTSGKKRPYEMLALGTHGRKGLTRMILGSVAEDMIRNSKVPVLVVGPAAQSKPPVLPQAGKAKIVVATDLGENSKKAEAYALDLAQRMNQADVVLFHSLYEGLHPVLQTAFSSSAGQRQLGNWLEEMKDKALRELDKRKKHFSKAGIACEVILNIDSVDAAAAILAELKSVKANVLIMGTHGRNFLVGAFLGSTARGVILESPVPVITVHSDPKAKHAPKAK
jgi:nucleotide-binding universal stress UspA family protein